MKLPVNEFIDRLASGSPVPGGGGASALIGAISVSLCSMVANLTTGKKKYAEYQQDIDVILSRTEASIKRLLEFIQKDADVFEPLSVAYSIPKDNENRAEILEKALMDASGVPLELLRELSGVIDIMEELLKKGSKLAISDVAVAACACRSAMEGAIMNIYINTGMMKHREVASELNKEANELLKNGVPRCDAVYRAIADDLGGNT